MVQCMLTWGLFLSSIIRSCYSFVGFPLNSASFCPFKAHLKLPSSTVKLCPYNRELKMVATYNPTDVDVQPKKDFISDAYSEHSTPQFIPWSQSITPSREMTYMPMYQMQIDLIKEMNMEQINLPESFVQRNSTTKPARIGNACFKNDQFRKIRMTYFDGGDNVQVLSLQFYNPDLMTMNILLHEGFEVSK